jgi:hypothetical protein
MLSKWLQCTGKYLFFWKAVDALNEWPSVFSTDNLRSDFFNYKAASPPASQSPRPVASASSMRASTKPASPVEIAALIRKRRAKRAMMKHSHDAAWRKRMLRYAKLVCLGWLVLVGMRLVGVLKHVCNAVFLPCKRLVMMLKHLRGAASGKRFVGMWENVRYAVWLLCKLLVGSSKHLRGAASHKRMFRSAKLVCFAWLVIHALPQVAATNHAGRQVASPPPSTAPAPGTPMQVRLDKTIYVEVLFISFSSGAEREVIDLSVQIRIHTSNLLTQSCSFPKNL